MKDHSGVRPLIQGYWARSEGRPRELPDWHDEHREKSFQEQWLAGWDECDRFKYQQRIREGKRMTREAVDKYYQRRADEVDSKQARQ